MKRRRALTLVGALAGLGYWLLMSPWSQFFGRFTYKASTKEKLVALSFDDGPNEPFTSQLADILGERGVKATFFQVGSCAEKYPQVTRRLFEEGHVIANHSHSHLFRHCLNWSAQNDDIAKAEEALTAIIHKRPALFRPPWLFRHPWLLKGLNSDGYRVVSGEFAHSFEVFQPRPALMAARARAKVRPGSILIFHDGREARGGDRARSIEAVKLLVDHLIEDGYHFTTIDKLLEVPAYKTSGDEALSSL